VTTDPTLTPTTAPKPHGFIPNPQYGDGTLPYGVPPYGVPSHGAPPYGYWPPYYPFWPWPFYKPGASYLQENIYGTGPQPSYGGGVPPYVPYVPYGGTSVVDDMVRLSLVIQILIQIR